MSSRPNTATSSIMRSYTDSHSHSNVESHSNTYVNNSTYNSAYNSANTSTKSHVTFAKVIAKINTNASEEGSMHNNTLVQREHHHHDKTDKTEHTENKIQSLDININTNINTTSCRRKPSAKNSPHREKEIPRGQLILDNLRKGISFTSLFGIQTQSEKDKQNDLLRESYSPYDSEKEKESDDVDRPTLVVKIK